MNKSLTKKSGTLLCALLFFSSAAFSQFNNVDFLRSGPADGVKYLQAYVSPWANAFGAGLNGGWYNTAKPHKFGGFDITTGVNMGFVPESATTFDLSSIGLTALTGTGKASTVAGPGTDGPSMSLSQEGVTLASFNAPPGSDWKIMPVPTLQAGLGLPLGTEIKGRFIPKINIKNGDISLWGVGVLHSIVQYFPGNKLLPFDVSLFGGYTKLEGNVPISLKPDASMNAITTPYTSASFDDQKLNIVVTALNVSAIASLNLPVVTLYGGLGYSKTRTEMALKGKFPTPQVVNTPQPHAEYNNNGVKDGAAFGDIDIENYSGLRANIGLRIKLAVITIHADYTRAQYNVISTGLGISFR